MRGERRRGERMKKVRRRDANLKTEMDYRLPGRTDWGLHAHVQIWQEQH